MRFGQDYPFHHVFRDREVMTARAAHAAGFAPEVRYAEPGLMVTEFLGAKTYVAEDVRANIGRVARPDARLPPARCRNHVSGAGFMFWVVPRHPRLCAHAGGRRQPHGAASCRACLALADELERAQTPLPIVFGHNDLLPANLLDDGQRLWLIDYEYAGFDTAMFDLASLASNAGMSRRRIRSPS